MSSFSCHFVSPQTLSPASNAGTCLQLGTAGCLLGVGIFIYFAASATRVAAQPLEGWTTVTDAELALGDAIPSRRVFSPSRSNRANSDGSAQFAYYSFANDRGDSPSGYLRRILVLNREQLIYQRTTSSFFVISSIRQYNIFYSRCNFSRLVKCFYVEYPAQQKRSWDATVARMSYSLR